MLIYQIFPFALVLMNHLSPVCIHYTIHTTLLYFILQMFLSFRQKNKNHFIAISRLSWPTPIPVLNLSLTCPLLEGKALFLRFISASIHVFLGQLLGLLLPLQCTLWVSRHRNGLESPNHSNLFLLKTSLIAAVPYFGVCMWSFVCMSLWQEQLVLHLFREVAPPQSKLVLWMTSSCVWCYLTTPGPCIIKYKESQSFLHAHLTLTAAESAPPLSEFFSLFPDWLIPLPVTNPSFRWYF